jgi:hypothetical protein
VTEVGSPKDYPGTWAGYVVHEGGIRQVVRRVAAPEVIRWTESTDGPCSGVGPVVTRHPRRPVHQPPVALASSCLTSVAGATHR